MDAIRIQMAVKISTQAARIRELEAAVRQVLDGVHTIEALKELMVGSQPSRYGADGFDTEMVRNGFYSGEPEVNE